MRYIVTKEELKVRGYNVVRSIKDVNIEDCECLIFNSSENSMVEDLLLLSTLKDKNIKSIFINDDIEPLYSIAFNGLQGVIVKQSSSMEILKDNEVLDYLVNSYRDSGMNAKTTSQEFESLVECVKVLSEASEGDKLVEVINNELWKKNLQAKLSNIDVAIAKANEKDTAVIQLLGKLSKMLDDVNRNNEEMAMQISALQKSVMDMQISGARNNLNFFPRYSVSPALKHVLYVKEESTCPFLRSFMYAYMKHVSRVKELNFKMLVVLPKLKSVMEKYRSLPKLSPDSIKLVSIDSSDVYVTFEPTKAVLDKLFSSRDDGYIVLDCSYGDELLTGHTIVRLNAVSSYADMERLKLKEDRTIMSMITTERNIEIPYFKEYVTQKNDASKISLYVSYCKEQYEKLDKMLNLMQE